MISRLTATVVSLALAVGISASGLPATAADEPGQVITVRAQAATSTTAVLESWERRDGEFVRVRGPIDVFVGEDGIGLASEQRSRTPRGVFTLTEAFGLAKDPGTRMPYVRVSLSHWWVSDVKSRHYNSMRICSPGARCGFRQSRSEQLGDVNAYRFAIVMDYNRDPVVPGRGSAFFLHVSEGKPTQGCMSMPAHEMKWLLRWLDPSAAPVISVNIGDAAYDVLD